MGIDDVSVNRTWINSSGDICISGSNFTPWSKVFINGEKVSTAFISSSLLRISADSISDGDTIQVNQMGSSNTVFRSSNEITYVDPNAEDTEETTETETEDTSSADNTDGMTPDAETTDGTTPDVATPDAETTDGTASDAATSDSTTPDVTPDAAAPAIQ